jgi:hypothetical protein
VRGTEIVIRRGENSDVRKNDNECGGHRFPEKMWADKAWDSRIFVIFAENLLEDEYHIYRFL